jgi:CelD/BcsL family acetyltransferase involved in cellulose biosynthesis
VGQWVRVLDKERLQGTLDGRSRTRGLLFAPQQCDYVGATGRVTRVVRRIVDDDGRMRAVSRTVLVEGISCEGVSGTKGCGRACPLLFRDEWLEPAEPARRPPSPPANARYALVRPLGDIEATLDRKHRRDGVSFEPAMALYAGQRFLVRRKVEDVFEAGRAALVRAPVYVLDGVACDGAPFGKDGPCDRGCARLWHGDWLEIEGAAGQQRARIVPLSRPTHEDLREWSRSAAGAAPFLRPEFLRLTARYAHAAEPLLVVGECDGKRAALAVSRAGRKLSALASDQTPRYDMAGDAAALPALWQVLRDDTSWDVLELEDVPVTSPLATTLTELARVDGFRVATHAGLRSPWFDLDGWESRLASKFRANLRRCAKNLGGATYERITRFDRAALDEGLSIERASWKGEHGTAIACDADRRHFYMALVRSLAPRGVVQLEFLRAQGRRIAFGIAMEDATTHYALKIAFDPEFRAFSPGHLLIERAAADAHARGLARFDFLGWTQEWKLKWTDRALEHVTPVIYRPGPRGLLRYTAREVVLPRLVDLKRATATRATPGRHA